MGLPSLDRPWAADGRGQPRIQILEIRAKEDAGGTPVAWVVVERDTTQRLYEDGRIHEASIRLSYRRIGPKHPSDVSPDSTPYFVGSYHEYRNMVSLTSESLTRGAVFLDLPGLEGQRIGTYLMNEIVSWVKRWPDAEVRSVKLLEDQADPDNKNRRNRFYEQFGLVFDYTDASKAVGVSRSMFARDLRQVETWKENIAERHLLGCVSEALYEREHAWMEQIRLERVLKDRIEDIRRAEQNPLRWASRRMWLEWKPTLLILTAVFVLAVVIGTKW